jgi:hypothetical protein
MVKGGKCCESVALIFFPPLCRPYLLGPPLSFPAFFSSLTLPRDRNALFELAGLNIWLKYI